MKRRTLLRSAAAGMAAGAAAAPAIAQTQPTVSWRMATSWPKSLDTLYGGAELVGKRVAAATGGKFTIKVFAAGEIVGGLQVLDAVQNGTVECGHTASYYYFGKDPTFAFSCAIPFGLNARQQYAWLLHGAVEQQPWRRRRWIRATGNCLAFYRVKADQSLLKPRSGFFA